MPKPVAHFRHDDLDIGTTQSFNFTAFDAFHNETTDVIDAWTVPPDIGVVDTQGILTIGVGFSRLESGQGEKNGIEQ